MAAAVLGGGTFSIAPTGGPGVTPSTTITHSLLNATGLVFLNQTTSNKDVIGAIGCNLSTISGSVATIVADRQLTDTLAGYYGLFSTA